MILFDSCNDFKEQMIMSVNLSIQFDKDLNDLQTHSVRIIKTSGFYTEE